MTIKRIVKLLSTMTTRDEAGRHFTERYSDDDLGTLESEGHIEIYRPIHGPTGIPYSQEHWHVEVTEKGVELVQSCPEFHPVS